MQDPTPNILQFGTLLAMLMALTACASKPVPPTQVHDLGQDGTGYIEFYCASCVTGWAVYEIQNGQEKRVLSLGINRNPLDLLHNPVRLRRVGIAYHPGDVEFVIRLLPSSPPTQFISRRIGLSAIEDAIIPVRIDARKQTEITMVWETVLGPPLPVANDLASLERLRDALTDPDWGVRWYAAEAIGRINGDVGEEIRVALRALTSDEAYEHCLNEETTIQCSLVSQQAKRVLHKIGDAKSPPLPDHESPIPEEPRDEHSLQSDGMKSIPPSDHFPGLD